MGGIGRSFDVSVHGGKEEDRLGWWEVKTLIAREVVGMVGIFWPTDFGSFQYTCMPVVSGIGIGIDG